MWQKRFSLPLVFFIALVTLLTGAAASQSTDTTRVSALQSCPDVEEEIVDLELLADGLKSSRAVGLIEKIRLRSSIDTLIKRMEAFHSGDRQYSLAELQEQYDVLLMKIAANLQHKDTVLHGQLCNAWQPIWQDLQDSNRFSEKFL